MTKHILRIDLNVLKILFFFFTLQLQNEEEGKRIVDKILARLCFEIIIMVVVFFFVYYIVEYPKLAWLVFILVFTSLETKFIFYLSQFGVESVFLLGEKRRFAELNDPDLKSY